MDAKGNPIKCEGSKCEGDFDRTWTQHTAFKIDEKSKGDIICVSAFDNGDGRGMEQPALPDEKYSRGVIFKIDQKKGTVEQIWEFGKERGHDLRRGGFCGGRYVAERWGMVGPASVATLPVHCG